MQGDGIAAASDPGSDLRLRELTLTYSVAGTATSGSDYTRLSRSVMVSSGDSGVTIPVEITDDSAQESSETVILTLTAGSGYEVVGSAAEHTLTITDND